MVRRHRSSFALVFSLACAAALVSGCARPPEDDESTVTYFGPSSVAPYGDGGYGQTTSSATGSGPNGGDASVGDNGGGAQGNNGTSGPASTGNGTGTGTGGNNGGTSSGGSTGSASGNASGATTGSTSGATTGSTNGATTGSTTGTAGAAPTSLTFDVLTKPLGGRYQPRNIGAIWIADGSGKWVKTLKMWANARRFYLTKFNAASGGNTVDATTSATLSSHITHHVTWNFTNASKAQVPDGNYNLVIELTDQNSTGDSLSIPFTKGPMPASIKPPDAAHFVNMAITLK